MNKMNEQSFRQAIAGRARTGHLKKGRKGRAASGRSSADARKAAQKNLFLQEQARSWLEQFHAENECGAAFSARWTEVRGQIRNSGAYSLTRLVRSYHTELKSPGVTARVAWGGWVGTTLRFGIVAIWARPRKCSRHWLSIFNSRQTTGESFQ
jgi:hypothetical protein